MKENIVFPLGGGIAGASIYSNIGGIGIIGGFGGVGMGLAGMTTLGTVAGSAMYGAAKGIEDRDATAFAAMGLGAFGGVGTSATIGGIGVSFGGGAFGLGMGSMAAMGGIFGLGVYGLAKMFDSVTNPEPIADTFNRMEEKIACKEKQNAYEIDYSMALIELTLNSIEAELSYSKKFEELEIEAELAKLKHS